jgi:hypothetical protein
MARNAIAIRTIPTAAAAAAGFGWSGIALHCLCHERALLGEPVALGVPPRLLGDGVRLLDLNEIYIYIHI